jgi:hypothetical protein
MRMSQFPDHGINDPDIGTADTPGLPTAEALLAGTLALMTGHAQACCEGQRALMAKKIIANLFMLSHHPGAPSSFRAIATNLHVLWVRLMPQGQDSRQGTAPAEINDNPTHRVLWHTTPETFQ